MGDHDGLFKRVFGETTYAAGELRSVLPPELVEALDLDALERVPASFVDPELAQRRADLLFTVPCRADRGPVFVYFLVEHQSEPDPLMPWRVLTYMQRIWASLLRDEPERRTLPPIVPLIVHHGAGGWTAPRRLHEIVDGLSALPALRCFVPDFELLIDDLARVSDDELRRRPLPSFPRVALWLLRDARDPAELLAHLGAWADVCRAAFREHGVDRVDVLLRYTLRVAGHESFDRLYRTAIDIAPEDEDHMLTAETFYEDGRERGLQEGREEGRERGIRDALERLLSRRFGPLDDDARSALSRADLPTLERWLDRVLTATSLHDALSDA